MYSLSCGEEDLLDIRVRTKGFASLKKFRPFFMRHLLFLSKIIHYFYQSVILFLDLFFLFGNNIRFKWYWFRTEVQDFHLYCLQSSYPTLRWWYKNLSLQSYVKCIIYSMCMFEESIFLFNYKRHSIHRVNYFYHSSLIYIRINVNRKHWIKGPDQKRNNALEEQLKF